MILKLSENFHNFMKHYFLLGPPDHCYYIVKKQIKFQKFLYPPKK